MAVIDAHCAHAKRQNDDAKVTVRCSSEGIYMYVLGCKIGLDVEFLGQQTFIAVDVAPSSLGVERTVVLFINLMSV